MKRSLLSLLSASILACSATAASASTTFVGFSNSGFYNSGATSASTNGNFATGWFVAGITEEIRDWFSFDLSGVTGTITAATLNLQMPASGFLSPDPTETLTIFDVTTSPATLALHNPTTAIFDDLGTGTVYGSADIAFVPAGNSVQVPLNATGVAFLNAHKSLFAFGGAVTSFSPTDTQTQALFNSSNFDNFVSLTLQIADAPEPSSVGILGCGFLALLRRRRPAR
jgi:hypothetical protein